MSEQAFSRRHFFFGSLLAGAIPAGGFGSVPSLAALGYKSPNEKLNIGIIGVNNHRRRLGPTSGISAFEAVHCHL